MADEGEGLPPMDTEGKGALRMELQLWPGCIVIKSVRTRPVLRVGDVTFCEVVEDGVEEPGRKPGLREAGQR